MVNCCSKYINWSVSDNLTISSKRKVKQGCGLYMHTIEIISGHKKILYGKVKIKGPQNKRIITACISASKSKTVGDCLRVGNLETVAHLFPPKHMESAASKQNPIFAALFDVCSLPLIFCINLSKVVLFCVFIRYQGDEQDSALD